MGVGARRGERVVLDQMACTPAAKKHARGDERQAEPKTLGRRLAQNHDHEPDHDVGKEAELEIFQADGIPHGVEASAVAGPGSIAASLRRRALREFPG